MDNFCIMVSRILDWVDRTETPRIPWIGKASGRINNPPAPHIEIAYVLEKDWEDILIGDRPVSMSGGSVGLYNVHQGNRSLTDLPGRLAWCLFLDVTGIAAFTELEKKPFFACVPVTEPDRMSMMFERLMRRCAILQGTQWDYLAGAHAYPDNAATVLPKASRMFVKTALLELLACLLQEGERAGGRGKELPDSLKRAIDHISLYYGEQDMDLGKLAAAAKLSVDHFGRLFRQHLGTSPVQYLQRVRIDRSRFLLTHTNLLVEEIAGEIGFTDQFYFSRVFSKQNGMSPTEFRKRSRSY